MKIYLQYLLVSALFALMVCCDTASNTADPEHNYFVKYYGGDGDQSGVDMLQLSDGTFVLLGNYRESTVNTDVYLVKVNGEGDVEWEVRIGENDPDIFNARDIEFTNDGSFIVLADFQTSLGAQSDIMLMKISSTGQVLSSAVFGSIANDYSRSVTPIADGDFIVSGTTELTSDWGLPGVTDPDLGNFINYRLDANLTLLPGNDWGPISPGFGGRMDVAVKTLAASAGTSEFYYVFGYSNIELFNQKRFGLFYFRRDSLGGESANFFPGNLPAETQVSYVLRAAPQLGNGFLVVGTSQDNVSTSSIFLSTLRSNLAFSSSDVSLYGTVNLAQNLRGVSAANSVFGEMGFLVLANEVRGTNATNIWLSKIDQSGKVIWSTTFGSEAGDDTAAAVSELPDGKVVILGTMELANNQTKMAFVKVNRRGQFLK